MDLTIDEMIERLDEIMDALMEKDDMFIALEFAQQLRDELIHYTEDYDAEE